MTTLDRDALKAWKDYQDAEAALYELGMASDMPQAVRTNATARRDLLLSVWHQREREAAGCE